MKVPGKVRPERSGETALLLSTGEIGCFKPTSDSQSWDADAPRLLISLTVSHALLGLVAVG
jgi:hypothetical protein